MTKKPKQPEDTPDTGSTDPNVDDAEFGKFVRDFMNVPKEEADKLHPESEPDEETSEE